MERNVKELRTVWVPSFICDNDVEMNVAIQDLADCVLADRESALQFVENLKTKYEDWHDYYDVSPHNVYEGVTKENATWYGWEFVWSAHDNKDYKCAMYIQETPIVSINKG